MIRLRALATALIALVSLAVPPSLTVQAANAEGSGSPSSGVEPSLQDCVDYAVQHTLDHWVCTGKGVTYESKDSSGKTQQHYTAITQRRLVTSSRGAVINASDYDSWCETAPVCHRKVGNYVEEVKGNAAYGNQNGVIGTFDIVIRSNLNGRQVQWRVAYIWDSGPSIKFEYPQISCWDRNPIGVWYGCGSYVVTNGSTAPKVSSGSWRWDSRRLDSARLEQDDTYHGAHDTYFAPSGYPRYAAAILNTGDFNCFSNGTCKFWLADQPLRGWYIDYAMARLRDDERHTARLDCITSDCLGGDVRVGRRSRRGVDSTVRRTCVR